jgi:NIPSNAP
MKRRTWLQTMSAIPFLPMTGLAALHGEKAAPDSTTSTVYELRVYRTYEGKLEDLLRRFREHTTKLFEKHGMKNVAYWTPTDEPLKGKTLIYILAHPSRDAAAANWKAFQDDPEWKSVRDKSEESGKIVEKVDSTFMTLTDFSAAPR